MLPRLTVERTELLGRFKTLSLRLLKWFYYNLRRELCVFVIFYKSVTDGPMDRRTDGPMDGRTEPLIEMQGRI